jgi:bacteriorhodopsin
MMSYIILLTTGTICFIEALRTNSAMIRHIFNLETCISIVAGYFYYLFMEKLKVFEERKQKIDWKEMTVIRYMDWSITTPMMLIVLCAALAYNIKKTVSISVISVVILLNYVMLYLGYLGVKLRRIFCDVYHYLLQLYQTKIQLPKLCLLWTLCSRMGILWSGLSSRRRD